MREALRTLAQCHSHRILHRDVKPGNFMLLSDADNAPLKAIGGSLAQHQCALTWLWALCASVHPCCGAGSMPHSSPLLVPLPLPPPSPF